MARHAIIDIGSNSIHLCIYECASELHAVGSSELTAFAASIGNCKQTTFTKIVDIKDKVGLVNYIGSGIMSSTGVQKAIDSLCRLIEQAKSHQSDTVSAFATASIRNCRNSALVVPEISKAVGCEIDLLSGSEEAHLGFVGITQELASDDALNVLVADIGGGSTELTCVENGVEGHSVSIPKGSLSLRNEFVSGVLPTVEELASIRNSIAIGMEPFKNSKAKVLLGIGGTVRGAARLYARLREIEGAADAGGQICDFSVNETARVDGFNVPHQTCISSAKEMTYEQVELLLQLSQRNPSLLLEVIQETVPDRILTLIPGCAILHTIMQECSLNKLMVCKGGIREGYLVERVLRAQN